MQLSSFTDYSIRVLIYLAMLDKDELSNIATVSEHYHISKNHLVKVVHKLGQLGYIDTIQGKNGGIKLKKSPKQLNVGQIIRQLEPLELLNCGASFCHISPACRLKKYLIDAKNAFLNELEKYTIYDLINNNQKLLNLL
ncbi:nitric oxide-sensing transcriptional repressor NsrR [Orbus sturtevantii]|uniref:nitric oxide-sensing transcriptional repressor NsrR n=1 Tax=Orbus sturtevantii TaxID=3074109 RepID=UPI00370DBA19